MSATDRLRNDSGLVVPIAMALLLVVVTISLATAGFAISSSHQSQRAKDSARALAAADSAIETAIYRLNQIHPTIGQECAQLSAGQVTKAQLPAGSSWCATEQSEQLEGGASFRYRVDQGTDKANVCQHVQDRAIVAEGTVPGTTTRRTLSAKLTTPSGQLLGNCAAIGGSQITLTNNGTITGGDAATSSTGSVSIQEWGQICGNVFYGASISVSTYAGVHVCGAQQGGANATVPKWSEAKPAQWQQDSANAAYPSDPGQTSRANTNACVDTNHNLSWNKTTRVLILDGSSSACAAKLVLTGNDYHFCQLAIRQQAQLIIPASATHKVRIWIEDQKQCNTVGAPFDRFEVSGNARVINQFGGSGDPSKLIVIADGGADDPDTFSITSADQHEQQMIMIAPQFTVLLDHSRVTGAIAADTIRIQHQATLTWDESVATITPETLGVALNFTLDRGSWNDCGARTLEQVVAEGCTPPDG